MRNKKGFSNLDFILAVLIFSGALALLILAVGSLANDYENENVVNPEFNEKFNKFENETSRTGQMWNAVTGEGGLSLIGTVEVLFFATFQVISLVFSSVVEAGKQLFGIGSFFGIPSSVSSIFFILLFSALTIIIIFRILNFVKGNKDL